MGYDQCQVIGTDIAQKIHCTETLNNKEKEGPVKQYQRILKCHKVKMEYANVINISMAELNNALRKPRKATTVKDQINYCYLNLSVE